MVILTHLKRQGGAKTHHTHDLSNHERISQRLENLVLVCRSSQYYKRNHRNYYVTEMAN
jgi:hypothetical protein